MVGLENLTENYFCIRHLSKVPSFTVIVRNPDDFLREYAQAGCKPTAGVSNRTIKLAASSVIALKHRRAYQAQSQLVTLDRF